MYTSSTDGVLRWKNQYFNSLSSLFCYIWHKEENLLHNWHKFKGLMQHTTNNYTIFGHDSWQAHTQNCRCRQTLIFFVCLPHLKHQGVAMLREFLHTLLFLWTFVSAPLTANPTYYPLSYPGPGSQSTYLFFAFSSSVLSASHGDQDNGVLFAWLTLGQRARLRLGTQTALQLAVDLQAVTLQVAPQVAWVALLILLSDKQDR